MRAACVVVLAVVASCATGGARGDMASVAAVNLPTELAGFRFLERHDYPDPRLGTLLRYEGPSPVRADVYLYPIIPVDLAASEAGRDSAARFEYGRARENVFMYQSQQGEQPPTVLAETSLRFAAEPGRMAEGRYGSFAYSRGGTAVFSHLYVFAVRDRFVKVRVSYAQTIGPQEPPASLVDFLKALLPAFAAGYGREHDTRPSSHGM